MTFPQAINEIEMIVIPILELTSVFHRVNNVLPEDRDPVFVEYDTSVNQALGLMKENNFSQIPVKAGNEVLGIFSYRSFSSKVIEMIGEKIDFDLFPVGEFIEPVDFVDILDDLTNSLDKLDKRDVVLVGNRNELRGLFTPIDLVNYLYKLSSPFILLGEIEGAIRNILRSCTTPGQLIEIARLTLAQVYLPDRMPKSIEEMTFNDYVQIIGDGRTWKSFEVVFMTGDLQRKRTRTKLEEIRDIRNDVFHFRREINEDDIKKLLSHRDWIKNVLTAYQAKKAKV